MDTPSGQAADGAPPRAGLARALLDASADGILVLDDEGAILTCNAAAGDLLGREAEALRGQVFGVPAGDRDPSRGSEIQVVGAGGEVRRVELRAAETRWDARTVTVVSLRDVTDARRDAERLGRMTQLLDEIVSNLEEAILITGPGPGGRVVRMANPAAERMFGFQSGEMVGTHTLPLHADRSDPEQGRDGRLAMIRREGRIHTTDPLRRKDGTVFEAEQTIVALDSGPDGPDRLLNVVRDVSEARRAERELRASEARFRRIAEHIDQVFWISGPDGRLEYVSPAYRTVWGRSPEELLSDPDRWIEHVLPSDRPRVEKTLARVPLEAYEIEYRIVRPDGEVRWIRDRTFPVEEAEHGADLVIGVAEDITDRKQAEERFAVLTQETADLVYVVGVDAKILMASPSLEGFAGYSRDELVGGNVFDWIHPADRGALRELFDSMVAEPGATARGQYRISTRDGGVRHVESVARNRLDHPAIRGIVVTTRDITERLRLEEQFRQSQKMEAVGRLAGGIAHDFNNLLTVIRSQTDLLLMDLPGESTLSGEVQAIQTAADRAARLTSQLLAFSRDQMLRPRTVDLSSVVRGMGELVERVIGEDVVIVHELAPDLPPVRIDPGQLEQAILNLALNARDAMPRGGRLTLATSREELRPFAARDLPGIEAGDYVVLRVSDTGVGMDEETQSRIFEPFFTTKATGKGTGLGLAMVYGFVKQSGGAIHVDSRQGGGATFTLRLPLAGGVAEDVAAPTEPQPDDPGLEGRVLVVEDDPDVRRVTEKILERAGLDVMAVEDAEAGREALDRAGPFDLLLTDLVLPGKSGRALVDEVRASWPRLQIVVMSGYAEGSPGRRGDLPGEVAFLPKPFTPEGLTEVVRQALYRP